MGSLYRPRAQSLCTLPAAALFCRALDSAGHVRGAAEPGPVPAARGAHQPPDGAGAPHSAGRLQGGARVEQVGVGVWAGGQVAWEGTSSSCWPPSRGCPGGAGGCGCVGRGAGCVGGHLIILLAAFKGVPGWSRWVWVCGQGGRLRGRAPHHPAGRLQGGARVEQVGACAWAAVLATTLREQEGAALTRGCIAPDRRRR